MSPTKGRRASGGADPHALEHAALGAALEVLTAAGLDATIPRGRLAIVLASTGRRAAPEIMRVEDLSGDEARIVRRVRCADVEYTCLPDELELMLVWLARTYVGAVHDVPAVAQKLLWATTGPYALTPRASVATVELFRASNAERDARRAARLARRGGA